MLNPACTPGEVTGHDPGFITVSCGCGWEAGGFDSRSEASRVQKRHRFPPDEPPAVDPPRTPAYAGGLAVQFERPS